MKHIIFLLTTTLLAASPSQADEELRVRYREVSTQMSVAVRQDIGVSENPSFASRDFSFGLALTADRPEAVTVTIDQAKATYVAHGMSQRLGTRHLTGQSFQLSIADDGRQLESARPSDAPSIDLGPIPSSGFSVAALLADTLPVLPEQTVAVGATWTTERPIRSLEGWAWASGQLVSRHRVTAVDTQDSHTVVTVATEAEASLGPVEGERTYSGDLKRTLRWKFDATEGRLLSMSMEQEAEGLSDLPQGEFSIHQLTQLELAPVSGAAV